MVDENAGVLPEPRRAQLTWTPELDIELANLWADPTISASKIGIRMNLGPNARNVVLGRAHRLGLPHRADREAQTAGREHAKEARVSGTRHRNGCRWIEVADPVVEMRAGKTWDELICGAEIKRPGGSLCDVHHARSFTKAMRRVPGTPPRNYKPNYTGAAFHGFGGGEG